MPRAPRFRTRRDRVGQFAPYEQNIRVQKSTKSDRVPIPGGYRLKKHALSVKTAYGNRGRAGPPLFSITKHKDTDKSVVTILYGQHAARPDLIDDRGSTDGDTSDDGDDESYKPDSTPSSDSEDDGGDEGSAMDVTPPPTPNFGNHSAQTTAAGPSRQLGTSRLGPMPRNVIDLTINN